MKIINKFKNKIGFTLIESLVAISILSIAITGPLVISTQGIASSLYARDQIIAFYLAQDAIEYVINIQTTNVVNVDNTSGWLVGLEKCLEQYCNIDSINSTISYTNAYLSYNSSTGIYSYSADPASPFKRKIRIHQLDPMKPDEVSIEVVVTWLSGTYPRSFTIKENVYNTWGA
ncbi:MAG: prepilin-type N-terminal cleavage/methylation domain-containing protein [Candidatus Paceibacterota bacterium]